MLYSVSFGKQDLFKKAQFQAYSAAISSQNHVDLVMKYINQKQRISQAKCKVVAYRVNDSPMSGRTFVSQASDSGLIEGFDDDGEEGAGQKLLHLLEKMGVENIMIVVCVWHNNVPGNFGSETFKVILERAKELLSSLHLKVLEAEKQALVEERRQQLQSQLVTYKPQSV